MAEKWKKSDNISADQNIYNKNISGGSENGKFLWKIVREIIVILYYNIDEPNQHNYEKEKYTQENCIHVYIRTP